MLVVRILICHANPTEIVITSTNEATKIISIIIFIIILLRVFLIPSKRAYSLSIHCSFHAFIHHRSMQALGILIETILLLILLILTI